MLSSKTLHGDEVIRGRKDVYPITTCDYDEISLL